jgi:hypothetical protein
MSENQEKSALSGTLNPTPYGPVMGNSVAKMVAETRLSTATFGARVGYGLPNGFARRPSVIGFA